MIKLPTLEEYFLKVMDIDITDTRQMPCPFHNEKNGKSLLLSTEKQIFSCMGACHVFGGDVVKAHMLNKKIASYNQAKSDIQRMFGNQTMSPGEFNESLKSKELEPYVEDLIVKSTKLDLKAKITLGKLDYLEYLSYSNLSFEEKEQLYERLVREE